MPNTEATAIKLETPHRCGCQEAEVTTRWGHEITMCTKCKVTIHYRKVESDE